MSDSPSKPNETASTIGSLVDAMKPLCAVSGLQDTITSQLKDSLPHDLLFPTVDMKGLTSPVFEPRPAFEPAVDRSLMDSFMKPDWHQLVIIGNGFDLECGLPSTYRDFFESRSGLMEEAERASSRACSSWGQALRDAGITVWELILQSKVDEYWYGIETAIKDWVVTHRTSEKSFLNRPTEILRAASAGAGEKGGESHAENSDATVELIARYIRDTHDASELAGWDRSNVYEYLLEELHSLEREFSIYLQSQVDAHDDYKQRAVNLIGNLLNDERPKDIDEYDEAESVLSFNYTRPFGNNLGREPGADILVNVHGSLDKGNIVFGIDGSDCMEQEGALEFTKTYRLMALGSPDMSKVVHGHGSGIGASSTDLIKFYGHSLADPDYSYFQAIFDTVGLYDGTTRLIFYFRPHKKRDGTFSSMEDARKSVMKDVFKLLVAYGKTMGNTDHGKNLIHKLQLEGRLSVKLLPDEEYGSRDSHSWTFD